MDLLLDTQILVWLGDDDPRLRPHVRDAITSEDNALFVSAAVAWEYADLENRGRFINASSFGLLISAIGAVVLDLPADVWRVAKLLPKLHRDPVDRMIIAHAMHADLTLITADKTMRDYPVRTLW